MPSRLSDIEILQRCSTLLEGVGEDVDQSRWRTKLNRVAQGLERITLDALTQEQQAHYYTIVSQMAFYARQYGDAVKHGETALSLDKRSTAKHWIEMAQIQSKPSNVNSKEYDVRWMHGQIKLLRASLERPINAHDAEFLPPATFYGYWSSTNDDLGRMARQLFEWLQIPVRGGTTVAFRDNLPAPGLFYLDQDGDEVILISSAHANDRFASAAVLAHEMMHLYLTRAGVGYAVRDDDERLTDVATIEAGFGVLIVNGMSHSSEWLVTLIMLVIGRLYWRSQSLTFGYFQGAQYGKFFKQHLKERGRDLKHVLSFVVPSARHFVGGNPLATTSPDPTIAQLRKRKARVNLVSGIIAIPVIILLIAVWSQGGNQSNSSSPGTSTDQATIDNLKSQADTLKQQLDSCQSDIAAKRPYVNQFDQSSVDTFNNEVDSCNTTENEYNSAANSYDSAIGQPSN